MIIFKYNEIDKAVLENRARRTESKNHLIELASRHFGDTTIYETDWAAIFQTVKKDYRTAHDFVVVFATIDDSIIRRARCFSEAYDGV